jgi:hypothetical protein
MTDPEVLAAIERGVYRAVTDALGADFAANVIDAIRSGQTDSILRVLETDFSNPALAFLQAVERVYVDVDR